MRILAGIFLLFSLSCVSAAGAGWESLPLRPNGTVQNWLLAGPFPNGNSGGHGDGCVGYFKDYLAARGGETGAAPADGDSVVFDGGSIAFWEHAASDNTGLVDLLANFGAGNQTPLVGYGFCTVNVPAALEAVLKVRSDDGVRIWLNGRMIHDNHKGRGVEDEEDVIPVHLAAGDNRLLVKVDQGSGGWGFVVAVVHNDGTPLRELTSRVLIPSGEEGKIRLVTIRPTPFVRNTPDGPRQVLTGILRSGGLKNVVFRITKKEWPQPVSVPLGDVDAGAQRFELLVPVPSNDGKAGVTVACASDTRQLPDVSLPRPKQWMLYLVQHTHTDIGYTRSQQEMLAEYFRYIDYALDFCDRTDAYPDDAKFRWTCETSWAVREYLARRPAAQIERLKRRIREGRIEVTGMLLNMSELATENAMAASLQPIRDFRKLGIPVVTAMQNDVNGAAWALTDYLGDAGVKYLTMGVNKTRSILPFEKPTVFWWESPSGKRLMTFRADHYMAADAFLPAGTPGDVMKEPLRDYLATLEDKNYPFDRIGVQYMGYPTDNSPPALAACDAVRKWNAAYAWPKLRLATAREFMDCVAAHHGSELPVYRVAWPDWWTDGVGSAARETGITRTTHAGMQVNEGLLAMASLLGEKVRPGAIQQIAAVQDALLFYDEHTYGAAESISDPRNERSMMQWAQKASFAWEAHKQAGLLREEALGLLLPHVDRTNVPTVAVFNTAGWQRSGITEVFIDHELLPLNREFHIVDADGSEVPAQLLTNRAEGGTWALWVRNVPAMGWKVLRVEVSGNTGFARPVDLAPGRVVENSYYRLTVDGKTGAVSSLVDKASGHDLVDRSAGWNLGQLIYEKLSDRENLAPKSFTRSSLSAVKLRAGSSGPIWNSLLLTADIEGCSLTDSTGARPGVTCEIRLYNTEKRVEFRFSIRKLPVFSAEAVYVAFPFAAHGGKIIYEAQGGLVTPGSGQLPGSASDWQTIQNFASVRTPDGQIVLGSDQVPLVQFGEFNIGKWQETEKVEKPHIYSWVMNNYWTTNFPATQEGEFAWSYYLTSMQDTTNEAATRFGWNSRLPLVGRAMPATLSPGNAREQSVFGVTLGHVVLVNAHPATDGNGVILCLREVEGKPATVAFDGLTRGRKAGRVEEVSVLEQTKHSGKRDVTLAPFEVKFVRIK